MARKFMVLDTEASSISPSKDVHPEQMRVYDLGFIVADTEGVIYERASLVDISRLTQRDTYTGKKDRFIESAYYADKMPQYWEGIRTGEWEVVSFFDMRERVANACAHWGVRDVWAYNAAFDAGACNATTCEQSNGFAREFLPAGVQWRDIWAAAGESILNTKKFVRWAVDNSFTTASGNPQTSAEIAYRYLTGDLEFVECHTALSDCEIELAILLKVLRAKKRKPSKLGGGWRKPAKLAKEMGLK